MFGVSSHPCYIIHTFYRALSWWITDNCACEEHPSNPLVEDIVLIYQLISYYHFQIIAHSIQVYTSVYAPHQSYVEAYVIDRQSGKEEFCGTFDEYLEFERRIDCVKDLKGNDVKFIKNVSVSYHGFRLCEVRIFGQYV